MPVWEIVLLLKFSFLKWNFTKALGLSLCLAVSVFFPSGWHISCSSQTHSTRWMKSLYTSQMYFDLAGIEMLLTFRFDILFILHGNYKKASETRWRLFPGRECEEVIKKEERKKKLCLSRKVCVCVCVHIREGQREQLLSVLFKVLSVCHTSGSCVPIFSLQSFSIFHK